MTPSSKLVTWCNKWWGPACPLLILASSGRALVQLAAASGYRVMVADCYSDRETRSTASAWVKVPLSAKANHWREGATQLIGRTTFPVGLVFGSGFESRPHLIEELSLLGTLFGNTPQCIRLLKDPSYFFPLLQELAIPAPETQLHPPKDPTGWLRKAIGGTGGSHVLPAGKPTGGYYYYQRQLEGRPGSVLFLANGKETQILGYHRLWTAAIPGAPYRYGGIAAPLDLTPSTATLLQHYLRAIVTATGLRGFNGLDFIQEKEQIQVLEVNPRPPASLDLYQGLQNLFDAHIQACQGGSLLPKITPLATARAFSILYAPRQLRIPPDAVWPDFCRDRPMANSVIHQGEPICSIHATGANIEECQQLIQQRQCQVLALLASGIKSSL